MAIMIKEFVRHDDKFSRNVGDYDGSLHMSEGAKDGNVDAIVPGSLMVEIEGIHAAPFATRNYTRYTPKALKNSIPSWTEPYRRPLLKHHNEETGEPIGRIISAEYMSRDTRSGTPALKFTVNVPDKQAMENVQNGLLSTVSIGVIAHDVRCSICGKPIIDAVHGCAEGHQRGVTYQKDNSSEICYWDIYDMEAKELSYVDVPSDMYAKNINIYQATLSSDQPQIKEGLDQNAHGKGVSCMNELEQAKAKVADLEKQVATLTSEKESAEKQVADMAEAKKELEAKVTGLEEEKKTIQESLDEANALRDTLEKELASSKADVKEGAVQMFITMREALGNAVADVETIRSRSLESINDSISDMKESMSKNKAPEKEPENKDMPPANSLENPTIPPQVKESAEKKKNDVDLKKGLYGVFDSVLSVHKN